MTTNDPTPAAPADSPNPPARRRLAWLWHSITAGPRALVAAYLGAMISVVIGLTLAVGKQYDLAIILTGALIGVVFLRHRLLPLLVLAIFAYFAGAGYSRHKMYGFCAAVTSATKPSDLARMAQEAHVKFDSGPDRDRPGEFFGLVCDPFSMCETSCKIGYDSEHILAKSPQGDGLPLWQPAPPSTDVRKVCPCPQ